MKKIHGIRITTATMVAGKPVDVDDELFVPKDISQDDAATLLNMGNRADEIKLDKADEEKPEVDGENVPAKNQRTNSPQLLAVLDKTASDIDKAIRAREDGKPVVTDEDLARLYKAEQDGNTRDNVVKLFESELKARGLKKDGLFKKIFG